MAELYLSGNTYMLSPTAVAQVGQFSGGQYPNTVFGSIPISQLQGQGYSGVPQNVPYPQGQVYTAPFPNTSQSNTSQPTQAQLNQLLALLASSGGQNSASNPQMSILPYPMPLNPQPLPAPATQASANAMAQAIQGPVSQARTKAYQNGSPAAIALAVEAWNTAMATVNAAQSGQYAQAITLGNQALAIVAQITAITG